MDWVLVSINGRAPWEKPVSGQQGACSFSAAEQDSYFLLGFLKIFSLSSRVPRTWLGAGSLSEICFFCGFEGQSRRLGR